MEKKAAGPARLVLEEFSRCLPGLDVAAVQEHLAVFHPGEGIGNIHLAGADGFDFR